MNAQKTGGTGGGSVNGVGTVLIDFETNATLIDPNRTPPFSALIPFEV